MVLQDTQAFCAAGFAGDGGAAAAAGGDTDSERLADVDERRVRSESRFVVSNRFQSDLHRLRHL